jgi:hypothetical protein
MFLIGREIKMEKLFTAKDIVMILLDLRIEPDERFVAAAGTDYGSVSAWRMPSGNYVIGYDDGEQTNFDVTDEVDDLAVWLEHPDLFGLDQIFERANIRGASSIKDASPDDDGPFYILRTRSYYGPTEISEIMVDDDFYSPLEFASYADAENWINNDESLTYYLANNETERPKNKIVVE